MTLFPTIDSAGHVETQAEADAIHNAIQALHDSETWGAIEENANHHGADEFRMGFLGNLHVADVEEWQPATWDDAWETGVCTVCKREVNREKRS